MVNSTQSAAACHASHLTNIAISSTYNNNFTIFANSSSLAKNAKITSQRIKPLIRYTVAFSCSNALVYLISSDTIWPRLSIKKKFGDKFFMVLQVHQIIPTKDNVNPVETKNNFYGASLKLSFQNQTNFFKILKIYYTV